jgi:hypothetical protein
VQEEEIVHIPRCRITKIIEKEGWVQYNETQNECSIQEKEIGDIDTILRKYCRKQFTESQVENSIQENEIMDINEISLKFKKLDEEKQKLHILKEEQEEKEKQQKRKLEEEQTK